MQRGNLTHLGGNRWRVRLGAGKGHDGRYRTRTHTFAAASPAEARKIASATIAAWDADAAVAARVKGTVGSLLDEYAAHRAPKDSPTTVARRAGILAAIKADLGRIPLAQLDGRKIDAWLDRLAGTGRSRYGTGKRSASTVHHYYRELRAALNQGVKWGMLDAAPTKRATPPRVPRPDTARNMPQVDDLQAMLAIATPTVRLALQLAVTTGMRRGELVGLHWSAVELVETAAGWAGAVRVERAAVKVSGGPVTYKAPKSDAGRRTIALPESMAAALAEHRARRDAWIVEARRRPPKDGPVLAHLRADPTGRTGYPPDWLSQEWERLRERIGRPELQLKGLRALHASLLAGAQVSAPALARRQGHAQVSTTLNYYTQAITGADLEAAGAIESALWGAS